jgi:uncharacterized hydrophobic protein (TIGR00271 family)
MSSGSLFQISKEEKEKVIEKLIQKSYPGMSFYIMMSLAFFIAAVGLLIDNIIIIVGSILIAPILYPIIFLGMSVVLDDFKALKRTLLILGKIIVLGLAISFFSTLLLSPFVKTDTPGIFQEISFLPLFYIAIGSGLAAAFAISRKSLEESLPGVAVSISLIPPLITIGVAVALGKFSLAIHCLQLFLINVFGIIFASLLIFSLMGFAKEKKVAKETLKEEQKFLEKGKVEFEKKHKS